MHSELPSDVVAFDAGSSVMACGGAVVGFHTARHVSLADVFISQSRVGGSSSWQTAGIQCWKKSRKQQCHFAYLSYFLKSSVYAISPWFWWDFSEITTRRLKITDSVFPFKKLHCRSYCKFLRNMKQMFYTRTLINNMRDVPLLDGASTFWWIRHLKLSLSHSNPPWWNCRPLSLCNHKTMSACSLDSVLHEKKKSENLSNAWRCFAQLLIS